MIAILGCVRKHNVVPKPVEFILLVWHLTMVVFPLGDCYKLEEFWKAWRLTAHGARHAAWSIVLPNGA